MDRGPLARIDSFPYRHRIAEVMTSPPVTAPADLPLGEAARWMHDRRIGSLLTTDADGRPSGILTERDLLSAVAADGAAALGRPIAAFMSSPVESLPADAYVFAAIGRMDRLGIRHLAAVDPANGRLVGVVSARTLLRQRAGQALMLGDAVAVAPDGAAMARVRAQLPALARDLLADKVGAVEIAGVISAVLRDISARAAALAAEGMTRDGHGPAPAPWCYLVLGSGGRGESLLAADQDNAIVHDGRAEDDAWFAELGRRASETLDKAGIPYCRGGVMAMNEAWRRSLADWRRQIDRWVAKAEGESLLNVDIFYDFQPVYGDRALAEALRTHAVETAKARPFLVSLSEALSQHGSPFGLFGRLRTHQGRVDLKLGGLFPLVAGARILALKLGDRATATAERLRAATEAGLVNADDLSAFEEAQALFLRLILEQQIADIAAGVPPSSRVAVKRLARGDRHRLRKALRRTSLIGWTVRGALSG